jgi:ABC-type sugar transport system ATPase subunit
MFLHMRNINKSFSGNWVLRNVDFDLEEGEIHALAGLNGAGKSTLIKILAGAILMDSGEIIFEDRQYEIASPRQTLEAGIYTIFQEEMLIPSLNVAENVFLNNLPKRKIFVDYTSMYEKTCEIFNELGYAIDPYSNIKSLSISERYIVSLARAYYCNPKILIMDEPMINLAIDEKQVLIRFMSIMKERGGSIVYISHSIQEILMLCDRVTVLRDGKKVASCDLKGVSVEKISYMISGNKSLVLYPPKEKPSDKELLKICDLNKEPYLHHVDMVLHSGEILGIAGLTGSGRSLLIRTIFGEVPRDSGIIYLKGQKVDFKSPMDAINHGFGYVNENRLDAGLFLEMGVDENMTISALKDLRAGFFLDLKQEMQEVVDQTIDLNIKVDSIKQKTKFLSGGNQQKVMVSRSLVAKANIFLLDEPTRGIDIVSRSEIYVLLRELANSGKGIILVSKDMDELAGICNRVIIMKNGFLTSELEEDELKKLSMQSLLS